MGRLRVGSSALAAVAVSGSMAAMRPASLAPLVPGAREGTGVQAFAQVAGVLRHPRCLNCHTITNFPRQGDDRHPHLDLVRRGLDDRGVPGQLCATCHQAENNASSGVPGRPNWHLAPLSMGWEGLSDAALCRALKDPQRNGGRRLRAPVPLPREELVRLMDTWIRSGAPCPR